MSDFWRRLQQACERLRPQLPRGGLNPPATEAQIRAAEAFVGWRFPEELREAYRHFNGATPLRGRGPRTQQCPPLLLPDYRWASLQRVVSAWVVARATDVWAAAEEPDDDGRTPFRSYWAHTGWLPVGVDGMNTMVVDLDPTPHGRLGQLIEVDPQSENRLVAPSLQAALQPLIDAVECGLVHWDDDLWKWTDAEGDAVRRCAELPGGRVPLVPGGAGERLEPALAPLPPRDAVPAAWEALRQHAREWLPPLVRREATQANLPPYGASAELMDHAEAVLGHRLPLEARACWAALNGGKGCYPVDWLDLQRAVLDYRERCTWAELQDPWEPGPGSPDGSVQPGPWRKGWFPVGSHGRLLVCLDLDPGPAGTPGQLIEIERPGDAAWMERAPAAPRRLADGLAPWLWQVAIGSASDEGFAGTAAGAAWLALQRQEAAAATGTSAARAHPAAATAWSPQGWATSRPDDAPAPMLPRRWRVYTDLLHADHVNGAYLDGDQRSRPADGLEHLQLWAAGGAGTRGFIACPIGSGVSSLLHHLACSLQDACASDPARPVPVLVDAAPHAGVTSLQALLQAEAARRGASAEGLLAALAQQRALLIVDHVEALLPAWPGVWGGCTAIGDARARVLYACAREAFGSLLDLHHAVEAYAAWDAAGRRHGWVALQTDDTFSQQDLAGRCRALGFAVDDHGSAMPNAMGDLASRIGYLVHAVAWEGQPRDWRGREAALQAWWQALAGRQRVCAAADFMAVVHAALVACWQPGQPLPGDGDAALLPWLCAAFGLREPGRAQVSYGSERSLPLLDAMARDDDEGYVALLVAMGPAKPDACTVVEARRQLGHDAPWPGPARLLLQPQRADVAGHLLALGVALAQAAAEGEDPRRPEARDRVAAALRTTLPHPLQLACTAGADLSGQQLLQAPLAGVDLRGAVLDRAAMWGADLRGARLQGASLRGTTLADAQLQGALLDGARFIEAHCGGADFADVSAVGVVMERCDLRRMRWTARWPDARIVDCRTLDDAHPASHDRPPEVGAMPVQALPPWHCAAVSPCGRYVAVGGAQRTLSLHDAATLAPLRCLRLQGGPARELCFDAEGDHLVVTLPDGHVMLWDTSPQRLQIDHEGYVFRSMHWVEVMGPLRFDPARRQLVLLSNSGLQWFGCESPGRVAHHALVFRQPPCAWHGLALAQAPARWVLAGPLGVDLMDPEMPPMRPGLVPPAPSPADALAYIGSGRCAYGTRVAWAPAPADGIDLWSPDGGSALLAVRSGTALVVGPLLGEQSLWRATLPGAEDPPRFSPCGRWLACGTALFDSATGRQQGLPARLLAMATDGRVLLAADGGGRWTALPG